MTPRKKLPNARLLAIETSCDETAAAVVENGRRALSNVVASQSNLHAQYGGVFPEVASREHIKVIDAVVESALKQAHLELGDVDALAVTRGPGLPGSLVVGLNMAKGLAIGTGKPLYGINHLEGHLYSAWVSLDPDQDVNQPNFPLLALIVSGGHTELVLMEKHLHYRRLGGTLDDAAGEAFDKIARLLGLSYPGGPAIQAAAEGGDPESFSFPRAWLEDSWDFSFSGLKTAVLHKVRELAPRTRQDSLPLPDMPDTGLPVADLAASFQAAVVEVLIGKTLRASQEFEAAGILVAGGVSANLALRASIQAATKLPVYLPPMALCTDNAAMIGAAGFFRLALDDKTGNGHDLGMDASPGWALA